MIALDSIHRILMIRLAALGDVLLTTPALRVLRTSFPDATINYLTSMPAARDIFEYNADLDECLLSTNNVFKDIMRMPPFDLALDFFGSQATQQICLLSGARYRVGITSAQPLGKLAPYNILASPASECDHILAQFATLTTALGLPPPPQRPLLLLREAERDQARTFLCAYGIGPHDPWIAMQPGRRSGEAPWTARKYAALALMLKRRFGVPLLVFEGPRDRTRIAHEVCEQVGAGASLISPLPLRQYAAILERSALLVASEGGVSHIAAALGVKAVILFNVPEIRMWFPYDSETGMVALQELPGEDLSPEKVFSVVHLIYQ